MSLQWILRLVALVRNMRLNQRFLVSYLLVCVIPLIIASTIIYYQSADSLEEASQEFASLYTSQIESTMNDFVLDYDRVTKSVLIDNDIISRLGEEDQLPMDELIVNKNIIIRNLMRIAVLKPEVSCLTLITKGNNVYQYSNRSSLVNEAILLQQDWYKTGLDPEDTLFITALHDRSYYEDKGEGAVLTVGRVLLNANGSYAGVLLIDLDPSQLLKLNENFLVARDRYDMRVIISTRSGGMVYHSDLTSGKTNWKQLSALQNRSSADRKEEDLIVLTGSSESKLLVRTEFPREKLLLQIADMKVSTILVIAFSILFIMGISIAMSSYITRPIKNLRRSMRQAEGGQYHPIELRIPNDEIGSLIRSYNKMIVTIKTLIEEVYLAEIKQRQAKFLALQHQINPHMLYNTLESIRMKALVKEQDEIAGMIKILARMFRLSLGKEPHLHTVKHEVEYTMNYLKLQNIRFDNRFLLHVRLSEEVLQCRILPLVFQPIVENSINHGFLDYSRFMNIWLEGALTGEGDLSIRIRDDGDGMDPAKVEELNRNLVEAESDKLKLDDRAEASGKSIGLKNIAERIKLQYGDRYDLKVRSGQGEGTIVELLIPARRSNEEDS